MKSIIRIAGALLVAGVICTSSFALTSSSLYDLVDTSGSLQIGDKIFSDFAYEVAGELVGSPDLINVSVSENAGKHVLRWQGPIGTTAPLADLTLSYKVTVTDPNRYIVAIGQSYTPNTQGVLAGSVISIGETVKNAGDVTVGFSNVSLSDLSDPDPELFDVLTINPGEQMLWVTKDILLITGAGANFTGLSVVEQSFTQTPRVPDSGASALLLGLGLAGLGAAAYRFKM